MQMKQYPREVHHVLISSAIPMLYPGLGVVESLLTAFNHPPAKMLFKTGAPLRAPMLHVHQLNACLSSATLCVAGPVPPGRSFVRFKR
jgi:hypothetical protein